MSNHNNSEELSKSNNKFDIIESPKKNESILLKGWNNFVNGIKDGWNKFQKSIEEQSKKNVELWNEDKEKINKFFQQTKENLDNTIKDWTLEIEKMRTKNKEVWVFAGCIFGPGDHEKVGQNNDIWVPTMFYKIVIMENPDTGVPTVPPALGHGRRTDYRQRVRSFTKGVNLAAITR